VVLGDRIAVMRDGAILQMATPDEIYNRPVDLFVANFTGATNVLDGTVRERSGQQVMVELGPVGMLAAWTPQDLRAGEPVRIAIRAENIGLGVNGHDPNRFTARVVDRRYQGVQTVYDIRLGDTRLEVVELGTAARHALDSDAPVVLPPAACWAYRPDPTVRFE
jgi:iron(III) transport system ATP-binding protein